MTLWTRPQEDRDFMRAVKQNRVMTVVRKPGTTRKDFGEIGFHQRPFALYFVFPRPLRRDCGTRVVGIKYDLIEEPPVTHPAPKPNAKAKPITKPPQAQRQFRAVIQRTATMESRLTVTAWDRAGARTRVLQEISSEPFDATKAGVENRIQSLNEI